MNDKRLVRLIGSLLSILLLIWLNSPARGDRDVGGSSQPRVLEADQTHVLIELNLPDCSQRQIEVEGRLYQSISIKNFGAIDDPGAPQLPHKGWLVAVPPETRLSLRVEARQIETIKTGRLLPAPTKISPLADASIPARSDQINDTARYVEDGSIYRVNALYPPTVAHLGERGRWRDQEFVQVVVQPVQYNPVARAIQYTRSLRLRLDFEPSSPSGATSDRSPNRPRPESPVFEKMLQQALINYEAGRAWRVSPEPRRVGRPEMTAIAPATLAYKIFVDQDGIYQLTCADLQSAGVPVELINPRTFKLFNQDREVAIWVVGESDGRFDPGDAIIFFGRQVNSKYTNRNVYWLTFGGESGRRMAQVNTPLGVAPRPSSFKATLHLEQDLFYQPREPTDEGADHWFWNLWPRDGTSLVYTVELSHLADGSLTASLSVKVLGFTTDVAVNPDHHIRLFINGRFLRDVYWDGATEELSEGCFPQSMLVNGENQIRVDVPSDTGAFAETGFTNWFEVDYHRRFVASNDQLRFRIDEEGPQRFAVDGFSTSDIAAFDISDATATKRLTNLLVTDGPPFQVQFQDDRPSGKEYLVTTPKTFLRPRRMEADQPSALRSPANGADYILITHRDFYHDVLPLARHRAAQGWRAMVVDVQDIYDEFSGGVFNPDAIRDFLAYAYANWQSPAPSYVLLVGDGTFDFKDHFGTGQPNFIPPLLRAVGFPDVVVETATDNRYVTISGDDILPDMFIGRLPVNTVDEARVVVNKILRYEDRTADGDWNQRVMFVADNADSAGAFDLFSDIVADEHVPAGFEREKIYLGISQATGAQAKAAILSGMNEGRLIVNYTGHSGFQLWAAERVLENDDIHRLANDERLPVVLSFSSLDGFFHFPGLPALSETFLRAEGGGVVAWWGSSGGGFAPGHNLMNIGVFDAVFRDGIVAIGPATHRGLVALYQSSTTYRNLIDVFILLGDPAMNLALPHQ
jgi:hypothetical protein